MIICMGAVICAHADDEIVTYSVEYVDNTAKLTLYMTKISSFDIGIAYDPAKLSVKEAGFTTEFKKLQVGGENMTISVMNDDALDDSGNTYAVFTGAGTNQNTGGDIDFAGQPLATISFEGDLDNSVITLVTNSASVSDIYTADKIAEISLAQKQGTVVTPEPIDGVVYVSPEPKSSSASDTNSASDNTIVEDDSSVDSGNVDEGNVTTEIDDSENAGEETSALATPKNDNDENEIEKKASEKKTEKSNKVVIIYISIAVTLVAVIAAVIIVLKKKKSAVK